MKIHIYVEGGGNRVVDAACREGFSSFFAKAGLRGALPKVIPCGPRSNAYEDYCRAWEQYQQKKIDALPLLLVDSEAPVQTSPWEHVRQHQQDQWSRPQEAEDKHLHFMAQCMEAWFLAGKNRDRLKDYFGNGFNPNPLPSSPRCEEIAKADILDALKRAAAKSSKKDYNKGRDSFKILKSLDPNEVKNHAPHGKHLLEVLSVEGKSP